MKLKLKHPIYLVLLLVSTVFVANSCKEDDPEREWEWGNDQDNAEKPRYIWIAAAANFPDFANSKENIVRDLTLAKEAGFTDIVVDVRPNSGDVLFETDVEKQVESLGAWMPSGFTSIERTVTWDYLQAFIDAGHDLGLKVHAGINTFSGGNRTSLGPSGMLYRDDSRREWATELLKADGTTVNTLDVNNTGARFFNPVHEEVQEYLFQMMEDLAAYPELDGIILDRGRFDGMDSDFSEYTRKKFEEYLGFTIEDFPGDVMSADILDGGGLPSEPPVYFKKWLEFRVKVIHDFMEEARHRVKAVNPELIFGVYVGAWYSSYYGVGVNWASPDYNVSRDYSWATADYKNYGYADHMDVIQIGAYAAPTSVYGFNEWTIEGFCIKAKEKIRDDAVVVGGPDIGNGTWATTSESVVNQAITQSVAAAMNACDGYFLFDMIHLKNKDQWQYVRKGMDEAIGE